MRTTAKRLAGAIRAGAARETERRGPGRARARVLNTDPLSLDVLGSDLELTDADVTLGRSVLAGDGIVEGDVLVLVEVDEGEWVAVDVEGS